MSDILCEYDNPTTMRREQWANGVLVGWIVAEEIHNAQLHPYAKVIIRQYGFTAGPFKHGNLSGHRESMSNDHT